MTAQLSFVNFQKHNYTDHSLTKGGRAVQRQPIKTAQCRNHCAVRGTRDNGAGSRAAIRCRIRPHEAAGAFLVQQLLFLVRANLPAPAGGKARRDDSASAAASLTRLPSLQMARVSTLSGRRARTATDYHDVAKKLFHGNHLRFAR